MTRSLAGVIVIMLVEFIILIFKAILGYRLLCDSG